MQAMAHESFYSILILLVQISGLFISLMLGIMCAMLKGHNTPHAAQSNVFKMNNG